MLDDRFGRDLLAVLSADGQRIATSDLLIASTALSRGDRIVTGNMRHVDRVPGLTVHRLS
jgi:predicted nucleic acid-binding protein